MSLKVHFLHAHLDYFPQNLGDMSEEHGERFYQDIKSMKTRYKGRWDVSMMADYCWCLKRDCVSNKVARKAKIHASLQRGKSQCSINEMLLSKWKVLCAYWAY